MVDNANYCSGNSSILTDPWTENTGMNGKRLREKENSGKSCNKKEQG